MARDYALSHDGDGGEIADEYGCRALWCAVLHLAIDDALQPEPAPFDPKAWKAAFRRGRTGGTVRARVRRAKAGALYLHQKAVNDWQAATGYIGSRDFRHVCWLAGMDPAAVEERARSLMASGARRRSGRGFERARA